ncbi:WcaI family glycosyltransferase [soil metagenome]
MLVAINYAPEIVGCAKYNTELAEDLVRRGHRVEVVTATPYYPQWKIAEGYSGARWSHEELNGVVVNRTPLFVPAKPSGLSRLAHLASFGVAAFFPAIRAARRLKPDVVFAVAPTMAAANAAWFAAKVGGGASWLHIQDFEVDAAFELGLLKNRTARQLALRLESKLLRQFDRVSSISSAMTTLLKTKGVDPSRVVELRNWVDVDKLQPLVSTNTSYRRKLRIPADHIVALYSGNMAAKQGIEVLGDVARRLATTNAPITLILCGEGPAKISLEARCEGLTNVRFLSLQPVEQLPELLGTADIHLLPQRPEAADLVLPSKLTGMLASGRPIVAMASAGSGLADEVQGCGYIVPPTEEAMTNAVLALSADPDTRLAFGRRARVVAETRWHKAAIIDSFETALRFVRVPS